MNSLSSAIICILTRDACLEKKPRVNFENAIYLHRLTFAPFLLSLWNCLDINRVTALGQQRIIRDYNFWGVKNPSCENKFYLKKINYSHLKWHIRHPICIYLTYVHQ